MRIQKLPPKSCDIVNNSHSRHHFKSQDGFAELDMLLEELDINDTDLDEVLKSLEAP